MANYFRTQVQLGTNNALNTGDALANNSTTVALPDNRTFGDATGGPETFAAGGLTYTYAGKMAASGNGGGVSGFYATNGGTTYLFSTAQPKNNSTVTSFNADSPGAGANDFTTICFMPGTLVATPGGEAAVESLRAGDLVLTAEGGAEPVRWMGRQTVSTRFADPLRVLPIRITAGALAEGLPKRDLLVSPDHALLLDGTLVHAGALVNGTTIRREAAVPATFTYWHVELADHSLVLAEGVPAETFIDNVDRMAFDNWAEHEAAAEPAPAAELAYPRAKSARQVPVATRRRLAERAALLAGAETAAA